MRRLSGNPGRQARGLGKAERCLEDVDVDPPGTPRPRLQQLGKRPDEPDKARGHLGNMSLCQHRRTAGFAKTIGDPAQGRDRFIGGLKVAVGTGRIEPGQAEKHRIGPCRQLFGNPEGFKGLSADHQVGRTGRPVFACTLFARIEPAAKRLAGPAAMADRMIGTALGMQNLCAQNGKQAATIPDSHAVAGFNDPHTFEQLPHTVRHQVSRNDRPA